MYGFLSTILCIACVIDIFYKTEQYLIYYVPALITLMALILTYITNPCVIHLRIEVKKKDTEEQKLIVSKFTSGKDKGYILKPPHAAFSSWTKRMILFYDHHCLWVGNDIGLYNIRYFIQFASWFSILCLQVMFSISTLIYRVYVLRSSDDIKFLHGHRYYFIISLCVAFVLVKYSMQNGYLAWRNVRDGLTAIDRKKGLKKEHRLKTSYDKIFSDSVLYNLLPTRNERELYEFGNQRINLCMVYFFTKDIKVVYK
jgi:hypothetical protein